MDNNSICYILATVGLPARGKTLLSKKITKYFSWMGYRVKVFSTGIYRRQIIKDYEIEYFKENNSNAALMRDTIVQKVITDMIDFLNSI